MFRIHKTLDIITIFHKPSLPSSTRVLNLLRTASANASEQANATLDQASSTTSSGGKDLRDDFEIEVTESLPTPDQLSTIIDYLGSKGVKPGAVVQGAASKDDALKKLSESGFARPIVVDWSNGKAVIGDNESEILRLLRKGDESI
ncbi:uncharacterized protein BHQ10_002910 [Talaromyces amestolkiae]|uniref:Glutaredoxin domain-containing protein n=1 Tax=Talaromyces amestolkiae TaxID=1196081 RepID=A0A364KTL9_TALAM|nr:uncharacterized protein BHQ10_002910 [Talaromyces amestolkiae]RAO66898.1 hypothetical protein BHQ10_002910 [Talaromyces amestolkiae]